MLPKTSCFNMWKVETAEWNLVFSPIASFHRYSRFLHGVRSLIIDCSYVTRLSTITKKLPLTRSSLHMLCSFLVNTWTVEGYGILVIPSSIKGVNKPAEVKERRMSDSQWNVANYKGERQVLPRTKKIDCSNGRKLFFPIDFRIWNSNVDWKHGSDFGRTELPIREILSALVQIIFKSINEQERSTVLPRCSQSGWVPGRGFTFRAMMWIYASFITWCLVH